MQRRDFLTCMAVLPAAGQVGASMLPGLLSPAPAGAIPKLQFEVRGPVEIAAPEGGKHHAIFRGPATGPLLHLRDDALLLCGDTSSLASHNQGKTWTSGPSVPGLILERPDASVLIFRGSADFYQSYGRTRRLPGSGQFAAQLLHLRSADQLGRVPTEQWHDARIVLKQFASFTDNSGQEIAAPFITGPLLELGDGTLLAANYGKFAGDDSPAPGFEKVKGTFHRNRCYLLASTDGGNNWEYRATIAYDGRTGQESFCEPAMIDLGKGELVAVMRTGHFAPLYQARSLDGGKSWGAPESLHVPGLLPQLALLPNGVLVCSFGWRPMKKNSYYDAALEDYMKRYKSDCGINDPSAEAGDYCIASADGGRTWTKPRRIADPLTLGFTRLAATGTDTCLVVTQRLVIPGESEKQVREAWVESSAPGMPGWEDWSRRSRRILEARWITVRPQ